MLWYSESRKFLENTRAEILFHVDLGKPRDKCENVWARGTTLRKRAVGLPSFLSRIYFWDVNRTDVYFSIYAESIGVLANKLLVVSSYQ